MKRPIIIAFLLLAFCDKNHCQFYSSGEAPASVKWNQVVTPHFKIVYPERLDSNAIQLANLIEKMLPALQSDMNKTIKRKLPVLLHSASVFSNGYVTLAPERMELINTPPRDLSAQDWISQLTLHETRHFIQLNYLRQGFTRFLNWGFGEIGPGLVSAQVPKWFYEGDAVYYETLLSSSGRGRIPGFSMPMRVLLLDNNRKYSFDKALLGSYRNYVPDYYQLGFHLVNYGRIHLDSLVWPKAVGFTARNPFIIWPFTFFLKKNYGLGKARLYGETTNELKNKYLRELDSVIYTNYITIQQRKNQVYTHFKTPIQTYNREIVALRTGLNDPGSIVVIDSTGKVRLLKRIGYNDELKIDVSGNTVLWNELVKDPRWDQRSYSIIKTCDLKTGRIRKLTRKTRFFSPAFSPDGQRIAVIEINELNNHYLTILNAQNGIILQRFEKPGLQLQLPSWSSMDNVLVVGISAEGKKIEEINLISGRWETKLPESWFDIAQPVHYKNFVIFRSSYNGIENLFAVNRNNQSDIRQVTFSRTGAYFPSVSHDSAGIFFSEYSVKGFNICYQQLENFTFKKIIPPFEPSLAPNFPVSEISPSFESTGNPSKYPVKAYHKTSQLLRFHSWAPFYTNPDDIRVTPLDSPIEPGIMLFSQNLLSSFISTISYRYNNGYHEFLPSVKWRGWYPVLEISGQIGGPHQFITMPDEVDYKPTTYKEFRIRSYVPLSFSRGKYLTLIQPMIEYRRSSIAYYVQPDIKNGIDYLDLKGYLINQLRMSHRDIYPKWGQSLYISYTWTPSDKGLLGKLYSIETSLFFPGLFAHHNLYFKSGYQYQKPQKYYLPINRIDFPRGYQEEYAEFFTSIFFNYSFPIFYPDWTIPAMVYIKRLRANVFYDWSFGSGMSISNKGNKESAGIELVADLHLFRIMFPFSAGIRTGYLRNKQEYFSEVMLGIDLGNF